MSCGILGMVMAIDMYTKDQNMLIVIVEQMQEIDT